MVTRISTVAQEPGAARPAASGVRRTRHASGKAVRTQRDQSVDAGNGSASIGGERRQPATRAGARKPGSGPAPAHERMSRVDTAWLRMDCAANRMMIVGVWVLRPGIRRADLCQRIGERLLQYPRFLQRVEQDATGATWVHDEQFDIDRHVVAETLARKPRGREQEALQERLGALAMEPLDMAHPLWQFHLVEDYQGGSAMMVRIHHCIADGIALISVTQSLVDGGVAPPQRRPAVARSALADGAHDWLQDSLIRPFTSLAVKALGSAGAGVANAFDLLAEPQQSAQKGLAGSAELGRIGLQLVRDAAALVLMPDDSPTRLKGTPARRKRVAWCAPIPLDEVRAVGKALNCSINDVLLSCVAGALGGYLLGKGDAVAGKEIRAMVPVNLRPLEQAYELGNRFGLAPVVLPIGMENPIERVYEVRRRMRELKGSMQPLLAFGVLAVAGLLIKPAQDAILGLFARKTTAVMTNVPGPREKQQFLGSTIEQTLFWVPQSGDVGLGVSILSYGGGVQFGVITDVAMCPDPQKIIDAFEPEFARLSLLTLMLPWGE